MASRPIRNVPRREELAKIFKDQQTIREFENLFQLANDIIPTSIDILVIIAGNAASKSALALSLINDLSDEIGLLFSLLNAKKENDLRVDSLTYNTLSSVYPETGQSSWDTTYQTVKITQTTETQCIGFDSYVLGINNTGSTITKGSCVNIDGVDTSTTEINLFIADGTIDPSLLLGVTTSDILDGDTGKVQLLGVLSDFDTTSWGVGNILYSSPSTPGDLTDVRPVAPDLIIPIALVLSTTSLLIKPVISKLQSYGSFFGDSTYTAALSNTAYPIVLTDQVSGLGMELGTPASRVVFTYPGQFNVNYSIQASNLASAGDLWVWIRKNGADIVDSSLRVSIPLNSDTIVSRSFSLTAVPTDYFELVWATDNTDVGLISYASTAFAPASPAVMVTVNQIN